MEKSKGERLGWKSVNEYTSVSLKEIVGNGNRVDGYTSIIKNQSMESVAERIFLLALKKSVKCEDITYCIGVYRLGTPNMEFVLGETDSEREYKAGEEVSYIYNADYTSNLQNALNWLNRAK